MNGPTKNLVATLGEAGPLTLAELADRLQYPTHRVIGFITEARVNGISIQCRPVPGEQSTFEVEE